MDSETMTRRRGYREDGRFDFAATNFLVMKQIDSGEIFYVSSYLVRGANYSMQLNLQGIMASKWMGRIAWSGVIVGLCYLKTNTFVFVIFFYFKTTIVLCRGANDWSLGVDVVNLFHSDSLLVLYALTHVSPWNLVPGRWGRFLFFNSTVSATTRAWNRYSLLRHKGPRETDCFAVLWGFRMGL